jgi:hypothetical protein
MTFEASRTWTGNTSWNGDHSHTVNTGVGVSSTVQPQTIKVLVYIVVATSVKEDIQVDIDNIATDLNGKADTDLNNITNNAKSLIAAQSMPSNTTVNLTLPASGTNFVNTVGTGWFRLRFMAMNSSGFFRIIGSGSVSWSQYATATGQYLYAAFPLSKNSGFYIEYSYVNLEDFTFTYAQGTEWEAN